MLADWTPGVNRKNARYNVVRRAHTIGSLGQSVLQAFRRSDDKP
jgi:hypothetical protein